MMNWGFPYKSTDLQKSKLEREIEFLRRENKILQQQIKDLQKELKEKRMYERAYYNVITKEDK